MGLRGGGGGVTSIIINIMGHFVITLGLIWPGISYEIYITATIFARLFSQ